MKDNKKRKNLIHMTYRKFTLAILITIIIPFVLTTDLQSGGTTYFNLPIQSRPAMPSAIKWTHQILTEAKTALNSKKIDDDNPNVSTWVGVHFSRHHIMPQTYLQVLYQLTTISHGSVDKGYQEQLKTALDKIKIGGGDIGTVVWAPVNLFEGPTGFYRSDDPGESYERAKPKSFNQNRWKKIQNVILAIESIREIESKDNNSRFRVNLKKFKNQGGFKRLVENVSDLAGFAKTNSSNSISPFDPADWCSSSRNREKINLGDLVTYSNNKINTNSLNQSKKRQYKLK